MSNETQDQFEGTYDASDNKLRLRSASRLPADLYARVKAAGFIWAPKQELFVAPMWTPEREDLLLELCGEITDEETSLEDRATQRAERFAEYQANRKEDAEQARQAVSNTADNIPLGQPILVGHHSEKHARKDAARIRNNMAKAVKMWETSEYWKRRAAGSINNAKYKEDPAVRARRIKGLEADLRKQEKIVKESITSRNLWEKLETAVSKKSGEPMTLEEKALYVAGRCEVGASYGVYSKLCAKEITGEAARSIRIAEYTDRIAKANRWCVHLNNRLTYERTLLGESGYVAPAKKRSKAELPILNYPGEVSWKSNYERGKIETGIITSITKEALAKIHTEDKWTVVSSCGTHRIRVARVPQEGKPYYMCASVPVFITDSKQHDRPSVETVEEARIEQEIQDDEALAAASMRAMERMEKYEAKQPETEAAKQEAAPFQELKQALRAGVTVVSAPQLFPTPAHIVDKMIEAADLFLGCAVLEPSAGTGNIVKAVREAEPSAHIDMVEISRQLCDQLERLGFERSTIVCGDFLTDCEHPFCPDTEQGFDRVLMNPPFKDGSDIKHIQHALTFLKAGGKLVAICADGPRQNEILKPLATTWEQLPSGTFEGTAVRSVLLTIDKA